MIVRQLPNARLTVAVRADDWISIDGVHSLLPMPGPPGCRALTILAAVGNVQQLPGIDGDRDSQQGDKRQHSGTAGHALKVSSKGRVQEAKVVGRRSREMSWDLIRGQEQIFCLYVPACGEGTPTAM